jgi:perosamine synthetase
MEKQIQISRPSMGEEEWQAVKEPIMKGWLTQGPKVLEFEQRFADEVNSPYTVALTSCTTALHLSVLAAGVQVGDEVIVPAFSWVATANAVEYCGAKPVFVDIDQSTFNIDPQKISDAISEKTKAIIPVHLFGLAADMDAIKQATPDHVIILEDAACAAGALYKGQNVGTFGQSASFSFHPRKSITTGEGGMITTNDKNIYEQLLVLRNHGLSSSESMKTQGAQPYDMGEVDVLGYNYRMTDLQAAIGLVQLNKMQKWIDERDKWAAYYHHHLSDIEWLTCPTASVGYRHSWQAYVTFVDETKSPQTRNEIMMYLKAKGIATRPGTQAIHMLNYYKEKYNIDEYDFPVARGCFYQSMAIPMHNEMTKDDFDYVINKIKEIK